MWCPEEEKKEKREEKSMPALFMEINRQYGMRCMQRIREIGIQQGQMPIIMIVYRNNVEELQQESKAVEKVMFSNFSEAELCLLRRFFGQILDNISEIPVNR